MHGRLIAARDAGAAVLLISEDLDEMHGARDVIHVISEGRLSPAFARGALSAGRAGRLDGRAGSGRGANMRLEPIADPTALRRYGLPAGALVLTVLTASLLALLAGANPFATARADRQGRGRLADLRCSKR